MMVVRKWTTSQRVDSYLHQCGLSRIFKVNGHQRFIWIFKRLSKSRFINHLTSLGLKSGLIPFSVIWTVKFDPDELSAVTIDRPFWTLFVERKHSELSYFDQKFNIIPEKWLIWEKITKATFSNFCRSRSHFRNHFSF